MAKRGPRMSRSRLKAERAKPTAASLRDFDQAHVRIVSFTTDAAKPREHVCPLLSESRQTGEGSTCPLCAMCGRLRVGKAFLHVCRLVGAAMCSACLCGSHDRWP